MASSLVFRFCDVVHSSVQFVLSALIPAVHDHKQTLHGLILYKEISNMKMNARLGVDTWCNLLCVAPMAMKQQYLAN